MPPPTWVVGQVLAASDVNSWFVDLVAIKGSDQSVTSSTALVGDLALFVPLAASCTYVINMMVNYEGGTQGASDIQWTFVPPTGSTFHYQGRYLDTGGTAQLPYLTGTSVNHAGTNGAGVIRSLGITGLIQVSTTAANLSFDFAQNTSNGTSTIVHAASWMTARRVS